jgi:dienelactone hydrolase
MLRGIVFGVLLAVVTPVSLAGVRGEEVSYQADGVTLKGYLAYDDAMKGKRPGVLVVHEWWGHNENARMRARMLAELGYTALAVDMYGDGKVADHPADAGKFAGMIRNNLPLMATRFNAARKLLAGHATVDGKRLAALGYCFGGSVALEMARQGADLAAIATFHSGLNANGESAQAGKFKAKVRVFTGADDVMIKSEMVAAFEKEMKAAKVDYKVVRYPGAKHGFSVVEADANGKKFNLPLAYNAAADKDSWAQTKSFLAETLKK